jgi:hypothetical protein
MNNGLGFLRASFFVLLLSFVGCATREEPIAQNVPLDRYRTIYLMEPKTDPRDVAPKMASRLKQAGFTVTEVPFDDSTAATRLEGQKKALAIIAKDGRNQRAAVCTFSYLSMYYKFDWKWWSFEDLQIRFHDAKTGELVFKTVKYNYEKPVPEDTDLAHQFAKISTAFFPGQPNQFMIK